MCGLEYHEMKVKYYVYVEAVGITTWRLEKDSRWILSICEDIK